MVSTAHRPLTLTALAALLCALGATPALAEEKGIAEITSEPGGAKVFIDGKRKGTTPTEPGKPLVLELPEGEYRLEGVIEGPARLRATEDLFVAAGAIQPVKLHLAIDTAMVRIPAGSFSMGCQPAEKKCDDNEKPAHRVEVGAFELGKYEVTFVEWDACAADGGCKQMPDDKGWGRGNRPVINVLWDDAQQYVAWLSRKTGESYRLPTEAEWEYAARAGTSTAFSTGDCIDTHQANYDGASEDYAGCGAKTGVYLKRTQPVGSYPANPWGVNDLHGNVWEWVQDCWHDSYTGARKDGSDWTDSCGESRQRVARGGSWYNDPRNLRSAYRGGVHTGYRGNNLGFRVARTLTP